MAAQEATISEDGILRSASQLSPQQFLTRHGSGVYTTILVTPEGFVVDWSLHQKRLLRGIELLNTRPSRPFQELFSFLASQGSCLTAFFTQHVVPAVKATLADFYSRREGPQPQGPSHAMLTVCVAPRGAGGQRPTEVATATTATAATATGVGAAGSGCGPAGSTAGAQQPVADAPDPLRPAAQGEEAGKAEAAALPVTIAVYCKAVQPPPYGPEHAVQAAVMGRPRHLPGAKASSWVEERRQYEERKPPEAAEILLSDSEGRILEGLVTNFCVITAPTVPSATAAPTAAAVTPPPPSSPAPAPAAAVLHVCGPQADAALPGVTQARVVQAAQRLGLQVVAEPPHASSRGAWREAFITNCIKRIQPLGRVFCPPGNAWGADPWDCPLPEPAGPHTTALLRELEAVEERTPWTHL